MMAPVWLRSAVSSLAWAQRGKCFAGLKALPENQGAPEDCRPEAS
jgi:hypothetical protein